jgi:hypothetical protein
MKTQRPTFSIECSLARIALEDAQSGFGISLNNHALVLSAKPMAKMVKPVTQRMAPARKPPPPRPPDDPAEYQRFLDMAREVGADEDPAALDRAFSKVVRPGKPVAHLAERKKPAGR